MIEIWFKFWESLKGIVTIHYLVNLRDLSEISRGEGSVNRSLKRESLEKIGSERARRVT